ncbi:straight fibre tail protein [Vibrio phage D248]
MINNTQPVRLTYQSSLVGYTRGVFYHSGYSDQDVVGKAFWLDGVLQPITTNLDYLYFEVVTLQQDTAYLLEAAFFDEMVDTDMLDARTMVNISDPLAFTTKKAPVITGYTVSAEQVEVGVAPPILNLTISGFADSLEVQWAPTGTTDWVTAYVGPADPEVAVVGISPGTIDVRARGSINIPDGLGTKDVGAWSYENTILLDWAYSPPSAPTNITFTTAKLAEPAERFDVLVAWDWDRGTGPDIREFVLYSIPTSLYDSNPANDKWRDATRVNTGVAQSYVHIGHPFELPMKYMVASIAWGPTEENTAFSNIVDFEITTSTPIDNDFTTQTGVEVTYAHIKGLLNDNNVWKQTFLIDAATGAVAIGLLDGQGQAPITFDPVSGNVNVKGSVITEEIVAANFVMANLSGTDNPKLYTSAKPNYEDPSQGLFAGYTDNDAKFKFDLGDSLKYIRWDGDNLRISGDVVIGTPDGDVPIGDGSTFVAEIFIDATDTPSTPTDTNYPPAGWSTVPDPASENIQYISVGRVSLASNTLVSGEVWSDPIQFTGRDGPRAPGFYSQPGSGYANFNPTQANLLFTQLYGADGEPVEYDVVVQYKSTDPDANVHTAQWDGSSWVTATQTIHGNVIVDGSLRAESLIADDAFLQTLGVNNIYDNAAISSGNPVANYKMRISLVNGSIHIR